MFYDVKLLTFTDINKLQVNKKGDNLVSEWLSNILIVKDKETILRKSTTRPLIFNITVVFSTSPRRPTSSQNS